MKETFEEEYWKANYSEPKTMDGIGNSKLHVKYLKSFLELELIDISSIIDFGFGYGYLFQDMLKAFIPYKAVGIEPSKLAFNKARARKLKPVESTKLELFNEDILTWCQRKDTPKMRFDLGICTSVFQYLSEDELKVIIPIMAKRVKYLYLTVTTDKELRRQVEDLQFDDEFALKRTSAFYKKLLSKNFTNISNKFWESKSYFNEDTSLFTDLIYRN